MAEHPPLPWPEPTRVAEAVDVFEAAHRQLAETVAPVLRTIGRARNWANHFDGYLRSVEKRGEDYLFTWAVSDGEDAVVEYERVSPSDLAAGPLALFLRVRTEYTWECGDCGMRQDDQGWCIHCEDNDTEWAPIGDADQPAEIAGMLPWALDRIEAGQSSWATTQVLRRMGTEQWAALDETLLRRMLYLDDEAVRQKAFAALTAAGAVDRERPRR